MDNNRPRGIVLAEVAGKALFSTKLGQVAPRPVPDPPEPMIARAPNMKLDIAYQIDRFVHQLRDEFPAQCKEIFVGYYTIHDYFDAYDIHRLGEKYLTSALDRIATHNSTAVQNFVLEWVPRNPPKMRKICYGTTLQELFSEREIKARGELFLTLAVISIRNALETTAKKREARGKGRDCVTQSEETTMKLEVPQAEPMRVDENQTSRVAPGLLRVGWRQPHAPPAAQVEFIQQTETARPSSVVTPSRPVMKPYASVRKNNRADISAPATPILPQQSPYSAMKPNPSKSKPRAQPYHSNIGMAPPTHQRNQSTPRMNAMTPGFIPQSSMYGPAAVVPTHGPPSQTATPQGMAAQLYLPPAPFQGNPHGFEVGPMHRDLNHYPDFPGPYNMQSNPPGMHYATPQATPHMSAAQPVGAPGAVGYMPISNFPSPSMVHPSLANMANLQYGGTMQDMRPRRMSGPAPRQDYGPRSQNKHFGKGYRGGRRNSVRGNYTGGNFRTPAAGQLGPAGDLPSNSMLPASSSEPFPAFSPHLEASRMAEFGNRPPNSREIKPAVWVHNIHHGLEHDEAAKELKMHFEQRLNRPVMDVRVNADKNNHAYALVTMSSFFDANLALGLHQSLFHGRQLTVKIPTKHEQQMPPGHDLTKGYPLPTPPLFAQSPAVRHTVPLNPNEYGVMETLDKSRRPSASERRASTATTNQRSRGPSRTYEATANDPMSYGPQDARRLQPTELPKLAVMDTMQQTITDTAQHTVVDITQALQHQPTSATAVPVTEEPEQRPDSRASSSAASNKQKKRSIMRRKKGGSNKSGSGTTTPEPPTTGSTERTAVIGMQSPLESTTKSHDDNAGLVDKKMSAILERREQERRNRPTLPEGQALSETASDHATVKDEVSLVQECCESKIAGGGKDGGAMDMADTNAEDPEKTSSPQNVACEDGSQTEAGKAEKQGLKLRRAKVALPDINIHSRKEKQAPPSTASSTRVSYAQAAASAKAPVAMANSALSAPSPVVEKESESRYYTPVEILPSPSAKSEGTLVQVTPTKATMGPTEDTTPEKDDSFVTVQEEPPSVTKEDKYPEDLTHEPNKQADDSRTVSPEAVDTPTTALADGLETAETADGEASTAQAEECSVSERTSWAEDVADHAESSSPVEVKPSEPIEIKPSSSAEINPSSPIETQVGADEDADQTESSKMGSSDVTEGTVKSVTQPSSSIHPNARSKGEKKKQPKKGKSYGKGKKGSSGRLVTPPQFR
ncbi:hypothetical protein SLS55_003965 [Diplodia seriata]|uniref:RRM domain-containing protein n=1 Tax=Diplodia seriata TaxID=420778 RepID=A0ABR3CI20_9PEZI